MRAYLTAFYAFVRGLLSRNGGAEGPRNLDDEYWDISELQRYFTWKRSCYSEFQFVDDQTWSDLDVESMYKSSAQHCTPIGKQILYSWFRILETGSTTLTERSNLRNELSNSPSTTQKIKSWRKDFSEQTAFQMFRILTCVPTLGPHSLHICYVAALLAIGSWLLLLLSTKFILAVIVVHCTTALLSLVITNRLEIHVPALAQLSQMASLVNRLNEDLEFKTLFITERLLKAQIPMRSLRSHLALVTISRSTLNDIAQAFLEYLRVFYLTDVIQANRAFAVIHEHQSTLIEAFEVIGALDASVSLNAGFATDTCGPQLSTDHFSFKNVRHPLIVKSVANSVVIEQSFLITGSNMSGKSTFIKTVGLNFLLARTLNLCFADAATIPDGLIKTAIHRKDNLNEGESYYLVELNMLQEFVQIAELHGRKALFLIDEIFRGTNSNESTAAAVAVLTFLARTSIVMITTHNTALQDLIENFQLVHFSATDSGDCDLFDYKLKEGKASETNALRLLEAAGFPPEVARMARETAQKLSTYPQPIVTK